MVKKQQSVLQDVELMRYFLRKSVEQCSGSGFSSFWESVSGSASKWKVESGSASKGHFGALEGPNLGKSEF
jgi:hypothetical protein